MIQLKRNNFKPKNDLNFKLWGFIFLMLLCVSNANAQDWYLPDTGQQEDYTASFGEDADYNSNPLSYIKNENGTITDANTGLVWQQSDGGEKTWENAVQYCTDLSLGNFNDWRLPEPIEAFSILHHENVNPSLDTDFFGRTKAQYWWTNDTLKNDGSRIWSTNSGGGIGPHRKTETLSAGGNKKYHALCVRGNKQEHYLKDSGDGTITDLLTGLVWKKEFHSEKMTWKDALVYCESLQLNKKNDWRLPNIKELQSLHNPNFTQPGIDPQFFPETVREAFWTSTTLLQPNNSSRAWIIDFKNGIASYKEKTKTCWVRAVRGGNIRSTAVSVNKNKGNLLINSKILEIQADTLDVEKIAGEFEFTEGPVWHPDGYLLFSDIAGNAIYTWSESSGVETYLSPSGNTNGITLDLFDNPIICQHGERQVARVKNGTVTPLVSQYNGKKLNSPNDVVVSDFGTIYFTDPPYGIKPAQEELGFYGVYRWYENGELELIDDKLTKPNGLCFSLDKSVLYVCDSYSRQIIAYEIKSTSEIKSRSVFTTLPEGNEPDGITIDKHGDIYVASGNGGIRKYNFKGELLKIIAIPEKVRNLCFGGKFKNTLFVTAGKNVYRVNINENYPFATSCYLARPTNNSVTLNLIAEFSTEVKVEYGIRNENFSGQTETFSFQKGENKNIDLTGLEASTQYKYKVLYKLNGNPGFKESLSGVFTTARKEDETFSFAIEADPHMDESSNLQVYNNVLDLIQKDKVDFLIDLGDNTMADKLPNASLDHIEERYLLYRNLWGKLSQSTPIFLAVGNHEGENGWLLDNTADNFTNINTNFRKKYFPNPEPNSFYSGNETEDPFVGKRQNYYAWKWGSALMIVLDPYINTLKKPGKNGDQWNFTLGDDQYSWFKNILETVDAKYKFVFCHHLVGGTTQGRGGVERLDFFEMGGKNEDGSWAFDSKRPGWENPIHPLMVENSVNIFFHGHDHFYAKQEKDGLIYQLVPQPTHTNYSRVNYAEEYTYTSGTIIPNSGYLRVTVSPEKADVEYVRAFHKEDFGKGYINGTISDSYSIKPLGNSTGFNEIENKTQFECFPNPASSILEIRMNQFSNAELYNMQGTLITSTSQNYFGVESLKSGCYLLRCFNEKGNWGSKKIVVRGVKPF